MCFKLEDISFHYYNVHKRKCFCGKVDDANFRTWQWWNHVHLVLLAYRVIVMIQMGMTSVEGFWLPSLVQCYCYFFGLCTVLGCVWQVAWVSVQYLGVSGRWQWVSVQYLGVW